MAREQGSQYVSPMHKTTKSREENSSVISIKCMEIKFMRYVNELSSSIVVAKEKSTKGFKNANIWANGQLFKQNSYESLELSSSIGSRSSRSRLKRQRSIDFKVTQGRLQHGNSKTQVVIQYQTGSKFKGTMENNKQKSGTFTNKDGIKLVGNFKNNRLHGRGSMFLPNGTQYRSTFTKGLINHVSEIYYDNGDIYKGEIHRFKKHGNGELLLNNGDRYQGEFFDGDIYGYGKFYKNGLIFAQGLWKNGHFMRYFCKSSDEVLEEDSLRS